MLIFYFLARLVNLIQLLLVVYALLSWFPGAYDSKFGQLLINIVEPILAPFRRMNLNFAGFDFTIVAVIIILNFALQILGNILV